MSDWQPEREPDLTEEWRLRQHQREDDIRLTIADRMFANSDPKPLPRRKRKDVHSPGRWWRDAVLERDMGCIAHSNPVSCSEGWHAHHVVPQQELRRTAPDAIWHPLSGVGLCGKAHRRHHSGYELIAFDLLPLAVVDFLSGLGYSEYLLRHYPVAAA